MNVFTFVCVTVTKPYLLKQITYNYTCNYIR